MNHTRHLDIYNFPPDFSVALIGAGGIGAVTALTLAKMGLPSLTIYDDDVVDETNMPGQLHKLSDIGNSKVASLSRVIAEFADDTELFTRHKRVNERTKLFQPTVLISAVDSIDARKAIWRAVIVNMPKYYIDARMAAEQYQHFALDVRNFGSVEAYENMLMSLKEEDVEELPCTAKATFYTGVTAAGHVATVVRNILREDFKSHRLIHYIPNEEIMKFNL